MNASPAAADGAASHLPPPDDSGGLRSAVRDGSLLLEIFLVTALFFAFFWPDPEARSTLATVFVSIMLEAAPFMLIGSLAGGLIEEFLSRDRLLALLPRRRWLTVFAAAGLGLIFPVCECAIVPVVKRLARKGLPASAAVAYLLGAPVVNPIVAASTALAYRFDWTVVALRCLGGFLIAVTVGLLIGRLFRHAPVFLPEVANGSAPHACSCGCGATAQADRPAQASRQGATLRCAAALRHAATDFLAVGHFLALGAFLAALAQTFLSRSVFLSLSEGTVLPVVLMMTLAVLLNLCSESDAFVAAAFRTLLPLPAQMAFLLTGPVFDLKLLLMYQGLFRKRVIVALALLILAAVFLLSLLIGLLPLSGEGHA